MSFKETTHLSEIIEESGKEPVIIFKFSSECGTSSRLKAELETAMEEKKLSSPIYLLTVQKQKALSQKIEEYFGIKHESPQIIILNKGLVTYTKHHFDIKIPEFVF